MQEGQLDLRVAPLGRDQSLSVRRPIVSCSLSSASWEWLHVLTHVALVCAIQPTTLIIFADPSLQALGKSSIAETDSPPAEVAVDVLLKLGNLEGTWVVLVVVTEDGSFKDCTISAA